ncbi:MAG: DUF2333 family protein [Desulfobacteraceae bacterium]|nr:MAG: DUF2333 family protein [Desulfobacteraceae bacterium]
MIIGGDAMEESVKNNQPDSNGKDFHFFVWIRVAGAIVLAVALIWGVMKLIDWIRPSGDHQPAETIHSSDADYPETTETINTMAHDATPSQTGAMNPSQHGVTSSKTAVPASRAADSGSPEATMPPGVAFVDALVAPMDYELNNRLWGWRPNDVIEFTDNINEYQLGVLEATRRAARVLTENISRTGSTAAINKNLERAMNSFMIRADRYLFPSAESQYLEAIANLNRYKDQLIRNEESFFTRTDNLVPLLKAMEELMGSCDENLVKHYEDNGDPVSTFQADNYYYYAKGVASALLPMLEAIEHDFNKVMVTRNAADIMEQAIESCGHASHLEPWLFVTESNLNGIFANHRANLAAHISHSRFYLGLMVESLSM